MPDTIERGECIMELRVAPSIWHEQENLQHHAFAYRQHDKFTETIARRSYVWRQQQRRNELHEQDFDHRRDGDLDVIDESDPYHPAEI